MKGTFIKPKPFKNKYKIKKQWDRILSALIAPNDVPLCFTKNLKVLFSNGEDFTAKNPDDLDEYIKHAIQSGFEIREICLELNYQKLIDVVETKYEELMKL